VVSSGMFDPQDEFDSIQIRPTDLPDTYDATGSPADSFYGVDLQAFLADCGDSLYGVLAAPEDIPTLIDDYPDDHGDVSEDIVVLSHTHAFSSKFDARMTDSGIVATQINFGSLPSDVRILDLRPLSFDRGVFSAL